MYGYLSEFELCKVRTITAVDSRWRSPPHRKCRLAFHGTEVKFYE